MQSATNNVELPKNIFEAIDADMPMQVKKFMQEGVDVTRPNAEGKNPLTYAAEKGRWHLVAVMAQEKLGRSRDLYAAIYEEKVDDVRQFVRDGADLTKIIQSNLRPMELAARLTRWNIVEAIAEERQTDEDDLAFHGAGYGKVLCQAAEAKKTSTVKKLLEARTSIASTGNNGFNYNALHWAVYHRDAEMLNALLAALASHLVKRDHRDFELWGAALERHGGNGILGYSRNNIHGSPISMAIQTEYWEGIEIFVEFLAKHSAFFKAAHHFKDLNFALLVAVENKKIELAKKLMQMGAFNAFRDSSNNPNTARWQHMSPLQAAFRNKEMFDALLMQEVNPKVVLKVFGKEKKWNKNRTLDFQAIFEKMKKKNKFECLPSLIKALQQIISKEEITEEVINGIRLLEEFNTVLEQQYAASSEKSVWIGVRRDNLNYAQTLANELQAIATQLKATAWQKSGFFAVGVPLGVTEMQTCLVKLSVEISSMQDFPRVVKIYRELVGILQQHKDKNSDSRHPATTAFYQATYNKLQAIKYTIQFAQISTVSSTVAIASLSQPPQPSLSPTNTALISLSAFPPVPTHPVLPQQQQQEVGRSIAPTLAPQSDDHS